MRELALMAGRLDIETWLSELSGHELLGWFDFLRAKTVEKPGEDWRTMLAKFRVGAHAHNRQN